MNLLAKLKGLRPGRWPLEVLVLSSWLGVLAFIEAVGHQSPSDIAELAVLVCLGLLVLITLVAQRRYGDLAVVMGLRDTGRRIAQRLRALTVELGADLRETPPIRSGFPPIMLVVPGGLAMLTVLGVLVGEAMPEGLRRLGMEGSYLVYLVLLGLLWASLLAATVFMVFLAYALIHDHLVRRHEVNAPRHRRPEAQITMLGLCTLFAAGVFLPPRWPFALAMILGTAALISLLLPGNPRLRLLFRPKTRKAAPRSFDWRWGLAAEIVAVMLGIASLHLLSLGDRILGDADMGKSLARMPVTRILASASLWCSTAGFAILVCWYLHWVRIGRSRNPARAQRPTLHLSGVPRLDRARVRLRLMTHGFDVRFPGAARRKTDIPLQVHTPRGVAEDRTFTWPPSLTIDEICAEGHVEALRRRHAVICRRLLLRAMERLFKKGARRSFEQGNGYWVAPHLWFMQGLQRDSEEESPDLEEGTIIEETVGPPWHRVVPLAARHHFFRTMRTLSLDMIFVEDGVGYRRLRSVLRELFRLHDENPTGLLCKEHHLQMPTGVRGIIHDYEPEEPLLSQTYPEPDYSGLGRARILHLYRDRGDFSEAPPDLSRLTLPCVM